MKVRLLLCLLAVMLLLSACSSRNADVSHGNSHIQVSESANVQAQEELLLGAWRCIVDDPDGGKDALVFRFLSNGKLQAYTLEDMTCGGMIDGTYKIDGEQLSYRLDVDVDVTFRLDENTLTLTEARESYTFSRISVQCPQELIGTWKWNESEALSFQGDGTVISTITGVTEEDDFEQWFVGDRVLYMTTKTTGSGYRLVTAFAYQTGEGLMLTNLANGHIDHFYQ